MVVFGDSRSHISRFLPSAGPQGISTTPFLDFQYDSKAALKDECRVFASEVLVLFFGFSAGTSSDVSARVFVFVSVNVLVPVNVIVSAGRDVDRDGDRTVFVR